MSNPVVIEEGKELRASHPVVAARGAGREPPAGHKAAPGAGVRARACPRSASPPCQLAGDNGRPRSRSVVGS